MGQAPWTATLLTMTAMSTPRYCRSYRVGQFLIRFLTRKKWPGNVALRWSIMRNLFRIPMSLTLADIFSYGFERFLRFFSRATRFFCPKSNALKKLFELNMELKHNFFKLRNITFFSSKQRVSVMNLPTTRLELNIWWSWVLIPIASTIAVAATALVRFCWRDLP